MTLEGVPFHLIFSCRKEVPERDNHSLGTRGVVDN